MKLYRRELRAVAIEICGYPFLGGRKEYDWYYDDEFPADMEERVKADKPFGGWYRYTTEEVFERFDPGVVADTFLMKFVYNKDIVI